MKFFYQFLRTSLFLVLFAQAAYSQYLPQKNYPKNYFQWPVGATKAIVANFGELRPNHYHMGLDCRTEQAVNKPVLAAADGYVARVKVEPWGFGQVMYINHPNGMTTLYAHLNEFYPALEAYVKQQQYKQQSWAVDLEIPASLFPVKKGAFIAKSGSTGGSQGPHVHFEIRDTKTDKVLNPLLMGMPIADNIDPVVIRLAVYDRCLSTYEQRPKIYSLKKVGGIYVPAAGGKISINTEKVSFAITAFDQYSGSTNQNGIYEAILYDNETPVSGFQLDSISYAETRYLNAHIDYNYRAAGGPYLQHLSRLPGYKNSIYKSDGSDGVVSMEDEKQKAIKILVKDPNGNTSTIKFDIVSTGKSGTRVAAKNDFQKEFHPGFVNVFENDKVKFYLDENAIYDSFTFRYSEIKDAKGEPIYKIHDATVPVHNYFAMHIKGSNNPADTGKMVMRRSYGAKDDYKKAVYTNGWYRSSFREFGNYQLIIDREPPSIVPIGFSDGMNASRLGRILFAVKDNSEEIIKFTALLDGQWLRFSNDKGRNFIYEFDDKCSPGSHELVVSAEDLVGNITTKTYRFTR
jgi:hypothetical protein